MKTLPETGGAPEGSVEPPLPTRFFTGRGDVLQQLDRALQHNSTVALSGMPGVGKTQIALQCARSHKGVYQPIYWAVAASRDTLAAGYAAIAWRLGLPEKSQKDQTLVNNAVRRWLREHEGWLLILDNADDLEAIQALLPPSDHRGHLLLTTRESAFLPEAEPVPIEEMPEDDGATFLLRRARRLGREDPLEQATAEDQAAARAITVELGGLPLALEHAGAYIAEIRIEPADFVNHYREERRRLLRERGRFSERESVEVTFAMAFEKVQAIPEHGPAAAELLRLCAMLAPVAIPETIVTAGAPDLGDVLGPVATSPVLLGKTIAAAPSSLASPPRLQDPHPTPAPASPGRAPGDPGRGHPEALGRAGRPGRKPGVPSRSRIELAALQPASSARPCLCRPDRTAPNGLRRSREVAPPGRKLSV